MREIYAIRFRGELEFVAGRIERSGAPRIGEVEFVLVGTKKHSLPETVIGGLVVDRDRVRASNFRRDYANDGVRLNAGYRPQLAGRPLLTQSSVCLIVRR